MSEWVRAAVASRSDQRTVEPPADAAAKVAWVTGATQGIGRACAIALARDGYRIVAQARNEYALRALVDDLTVMGADAVIVVGSVEDKAAVERGPEVALRQWGRLDVLVNSAGVSGRTAPVGDPRAGQGVVRVAE